VIFRDKTNEMNSQGMIVAEKEVLFDVVVDGFSVVDGLIALLAAC